MTWTLENNKMFNSTDSQNQWWLGWRWWWWWWWLWW